MKSDKIWFRFYNFSYVVDLLYWRFNRVSLNRLILKIDIMLKIFCYWGLGVWYLDGFVGFGFFGSVLYIYIFRFNKIIRIFFIGFGLGFIKFGSVEVLYRWIKWDN